MMFRFVARVRLYGLFRHIRSGTGKSCAEYVQNLFMNEVFRVYTSPVSYTHLFPLSLTFLLYGWQYRLFFVYATIIILNTNKKFVRIRLSIRSEERRVGKECRL